MKFMLAAALAALLLAGCATGGAMGGDDDAALLECRAKADEMYKARYTNKWEAAVQECLKEKQ